MRGSRRFALALVSLVVLAGCATTKITDSQSNVGGERLPRPSHIFVYDFAATPADAAEDAQYDEPSAPQSAEEIEAGRKLGAQVATELVAKIQAMGLAAQVGSAQTAPRVDDIVIRGLFASIEEGSTGKRMVIGFGSGKADLQTEVDVYQMTSTGLRKLGSGSIESAGGKSPGLLVPLAVTVATANPIGLLVGGAIKAEGEISGRTTVEGSAKRTATQIATRLQTAFQDQGWI